MLKMKLSEAGYLVLNVAYVSLSLSTVHFYIKVHQINPFWFRPGRHQKFCVHICDRTEQMYISHAVIATFHLYNISTFIVICKVAKG